MCFVRSVLLSSIAVSAVTAASGQDVFDPPPPVMTTVNYTDPYDGAALMGYSVVPADAAADGKDGRPIVVVIPDWDGVNAYEQTRAAMFADVGWVAFAADIYGAENHQPETREEKAALATLYRGNLTLFNARISAAIAAAGLVGGGDPERGVAVVGYCFGGSGSMNYALSGMDGADAAVAFHGSLNGVAVALNETVRARVLILSGGEDSQDSTESVIAMEDALNSGGELWEISRYSDVGHGFTKFGTDNYNGYVDERSWESCVSFLAEVFQDVELEADIPDPGGVVVAAVNYTDVDGTELRGFVSYPPDKSAIPKPAVVIIHDADGPNLVEKTRAQMLADLGYVGFAADIFGIDHGADMTNRTELFAMINSYRTDIDLYVQRIKAAVAAVKADPLVDPTKIAIIGYCFGGTGVINYAMVGESEAIAVVSFHGGLSTVAPVGDNKIHVRMNVQSGGDDDAGSAVEDLEGAMKARGALWEYTRYQGVVHAFTNWERPDRYNLRADVRSWESMGTFLETSFALADVNLTAMPTAVPVPVPLPTAPLPGGPGTGSPVAMSTPMPSSMEPPPSTGVPSGAGRTVLVGCVRVSIVSAAVYSLLL